MLFMSFIIASRPVTHSHLFFLTANSFSSSSAEVMVPSLTDGYLSRLSLNLNLYKTCFMISIISLRSFFAFAGKEFGIWWNKTQSAEICIGNGSLT